MSTLTHTQRPTASPATSDRAPWRTSAAARRWPTIEQFLAEARTGRRPDMKAAAKPGPATR